MLSSKPYWKSEIMLVVGILNHARSCAKESILNSCITSTRVQKQMFFLNPHPAVACISRMGWDIKAKNTCKMKLLLFSVMFRVQPPINLLDIILLLQGASGTPLQQLSVVALVASP